MTLKCAFGSSMQVDNKVLHITTIGTILRMLTITIVQCYQSFCCNDYQPSVSASRGVHAISIAIKWYPKEILLNGSSTTQPIQQLPLEQSHRSIHVANAS